MMTLGRQMDTEKTDPLKGTWYGKKNGKMFRYDILNGNILKWPNGDEEKFEYDKNKKRISVFHEGQFELTATLNASDLLQWDNGVVWTKDESQDSGTYVCVSQASFKNF